MLNFFKRLTDNNNPNSLATMLRRKRFSLFLDIIKDNPHQSLNILDVGGTELFWDTMQFKSYPHRITLLNLEAAPVRNPSFRSIAGDARKMPVFKDKEFDIVFSNSVIEHVGSFTDQRAMAGEIRRVGIKYILQTPSYSFPFEPHFLFPFFHWFPVKLKIWLVFKFHLGWYGGNVKNWTDAKNAVTSIRLLKESELRTFFPDAVILKERLFGLTKSFIVIRK